jgi:hypothetical protein
MRWRIGTIAVVVAALASAPAWASSGYSVGVKADSPVAVGQSFKIRAHGKEAQKALLYVYLSKKACRKTWLGEAERDGTYKDGESYFHDPYSHGGRVTFRHAWVQAGSFKHSFTAHAGDTAEREHACAYLATPNRYGGYRVNAARGISVYTVTS